MLIAIGIGKCICVHEKILGVYMREREKEQERESIRNYLCIKKLKENFFSTAIEAHLLNNDDSSSFSTTIEGT